MKDDSGQSLAEMAIMLPIFVLMIFAALVLSDIAHDRLRAHEVARYAAFSSAHMSVRNYEDMPGWTVPILGSLGGRMQEANTKIRARSLLKYRNASAINPIIGKREEIRVNMSQKQIEYIPVASIGEISTALGAGGAAPVIAIFGDVLTWGVSFYNTLLGLEGSAIVNAEAQVPMRFALPWQWLGLSLDNKLESITIKENVTVLADSWALGDGRDVAPGGYLDLSATPKKYSAMERQVDRLYLLQGMSSGLRGFQSIIDILKTVVMAPNILISDDPNSIKNARVIMHNFRADGQGTVDIFKAIGQVPTWKDDPALRVFDTTHLRDNPNAPGQSRQLMRALQRGPYYKGCPEPELLGCKR